MRKFLGLYLGFLLLPVSLCAADFKAGEIIVAFKAAPTQVQLDREALKQGWPSGLSAGEAQRFMRLIYAGELKRVLPALGIESWIIGAAQSVTQTVENLEASELVDYAEPNYIYKALATGPADDLFSNQWYYSQVKGDQAFDAFKAGTIILSASVKVAVLDTGLGPHSQMNAGQVDTANAKSFYPGTGEIWSKDDSGHGTAVAGLIGATTEDSSGSSGIAGLFFDQSKLTLLPVKVLGGNTGTGSLDDIAAGILYAVAQGSQVMNMSLGSEVNGITMENAIKSATDAGVLVVAAAGNASSAVDFPASYPNVVAVGALTSAGARTSYSNFGRLDLSAPGGDAVSSCGCAAQTFPQTCWGSEILSLATDAAFNCATANSYIAEPGTSFAAPMVTAAAALLLAQDSSRSAADLLRILTQSTDATAYGSAYNEQVGWGQLNIYRALTGDTFHSEFKKKPLQVYNWPNPFNPRREGVTTIDFVLQVSAAVKISIYDQGGDRVLRRSLGAGDTQAGLNAMAWDGRNEKGDMVANGSYMLVLETGGGRVSNWIAVAQ